MEQEVKYPTQPTTDGWYTENETDAAFEILTKEYENGSLVKKVTLKKGKLKGSEVIIRELKANDSDAVSRMVKGSKNVEQDYSRLTLFKASNLAELGLVVEDIADLAASDYNKLNVMNASLNFI